MQIAIPLFARVTALDAVGPYEVLQRVPSIEIVFVGAEPGLVRTDNGFLGLAVDGPSGGCRGRRRRQPPPRGVESRTPCAARRRSNSAPPSTALILRGRIWCW